MTTLERIPVTVHPGTGGTQPGAGTVDVGHLKRRLEQTVRGEVRFDQVKSMMSALAGGDENRGRIIKESIKGKLHEFTTR